MNPMVALTGFRCSRRAAPMAFALGLALFPAAGFGQLSAPTESGCASCHFAHPESPRPFHLAEWDHSAHGRRDVGCEKCHGGDATTFEIFAAHEGILSSRNPASPTHRSNLPRTCGQCHIGPFVAFQKSRHYALLAEGAPDGPTCSTCHGEVGAHLPSPKALAQRCARCHGEDRRAPRPDFPTQGRDLLQGVTELRALLQPVPRLIHRIKDPVRRERLLELHEQAQVPLIEAVQSAHSFVFRQLTERLAVARRRTESLLDELANP